MFFFFGVSSFSYVSPAISDPQYIFTLHHLLVCKRNARFAPPLLKKLPLEESTTGFAEERDLMTAGDLGVGTRTASLTANAPMAAVVFRK